MSPTPRNIERVNQHDLQVAWDDGHVSVYLARALRSACPCAQCVDEASGASRLGPTSLPIDVHPLKIGLVGRCAIDIQWSDGHRTGIYGFELLRGLCPCQECRAPAEVAPAAEDPRPASFALPVLGQPGPATRPQSHGLAPLAAGEPLSPLRTMGEVFAAYPGAPRALFLRYHLGGCGSCAFPLGASLAELCAQHGLEPTEVAEAIMRSAEFEQQLRIKPRELAALLAQGQRVRVLDVRSTEEWIATRIPGALHLTDTRVEGILQSWAKETEMVFYCHHGDESAVTADYFIGHGFHQVQILEGGIDAWSVEVNPSVRRYRLEHPPPPPGVAASHRRRLGT